MILARHEAAPLRFLIGVVIAWTAVRGAMLSGWRPGEEAPARWGPVPGWLLDAMPPAVRPHLIATTTAQPARIATAARPDDTRRPAAAPLPDPGPIRAMAGLSGDAMRLLSLAAAQPIGGHFFGRGEDASAATAALATPLPPQSDSDASRLSGSAWSYVREGSGARSLSPDGQLGGSQAGVRVLYRVAGTLAASARLSRALAGPPQTEAALGLDWQPARALPVHLMLDRRIAIDKGARDAWALGVSGGAYAVRVADQTRLDGYAQAGVVGARSRDLYADGAIRMGREMALGDGRSLTVGGGAWGAAQPGVARFDLGPSAVLRVPVEKTTLAAAIDWRERVAGDARPGSGAALTLGVDF